MNSSTNTDDKQVNKPIAKPDVSGSLRVVDTSYGGCTGIHDYFIADGRIITCHPDELDSLINCGQR